MGLIRVTVAGSFGKMNSERTFTAMNNGHVDAITGAIEHLVSLLPAANELDHQLHSEGETPKDGWKRKLRGEQEVSI